MLMWKGSFGFKKAGFPLPNRSDLLFFASLFDPTTLKIKDSVGANERTLYPLQYIQADGTGYFTHASLTSAATITKNGTSTCSFATAGRMTCTTGTLWDFTITFADAYVGAYKFCSQTGASSGTVFDCNAGQRHLVATGFATIANVFGRGWSYGSDFLSLNGYTATAYAPVPASSSDPAKDAIGNTLQYPGRAKYSLAPVDAPCGTMASGTSIAITTTTGVAIASGSSYVNGGTATVTIGTNSIAYLTAGSIYNLRITSNGRTITFPLSERSGSTVFGYDDLGNTYTGTATSSNLAAFRAGRQSTYFHGLQYGYSAGGLGPELITNAADREFSSDTGFWTKDPGWGISGGTANHIGALNYFVWRDNFIKNGVTYRFSFDIISVTSGGVAATAGSINGVTRSSIGSYIDYVVSNGAAFGFQAYNFIGSIDNVSLRELYPSTCCIPANPYTGKDCLGNTLTNPPLIPNDSASYQLPAAAECITAYPSAYTVGVPNTYTQAQLQSLGVGPRLFHGATNHKTALYDANQDASSQVKIAKVIK